MRYKFFKDVCAHLALVFVFAGTCSVGICGESHRTINLNPIWRFHLGSLTNEPTKADYDDSSWDIVSLPHSEEIFSANVTGFRQRGRTFGWYRRELDVPEQWLGKREFLEFQGAMEATTLWVNGKPVGKYAVSGFDSFDFDITQYLKPGKNVIAVEVDNQVNPVLPPDGREMDYLLFGGLYRDVFLHVTDPVHLTFLWEGRQAGVRLTLPEVSEKQAVVKSEATVRNDSTS